MTTIIGIFYYLLFFSIPLVLFPKTSEIFEFNKMVLTYLLTISISSLWILKMIIEKRIIFRRSYLDIPLVVFLVFQFLSFLVSIDKRTSLLGYYSRFHGGFLSLLSYSLLYWAYVSNMDAKKTLKAIYFLLISGILVSFYSVLQHFGIDKNVWIQDVQSRVFSTLGQPNWLAAWIVGLLPITWASALISKIKNQKSKLQLNYFWILLSAIFFNVLLYSGSRSGLLGFAVADITFWILVFRTQTQKIMDSRKNFLKTFVICHLSFVILAAVNGTPRTPSLKTLFTASKLPAQISNLEPALETGGTESADIRKIVWQGAIDIWKNYPLLGTGVETFAFAYYKFRPAAHNLTSEWDYLYNKAHNEYLNYLATTGIVGLVAYITLIAAILWTVVKELRIMNYELDDESHNSYAIIHCSLLAGFAGILVTNFFGFSVVPTALLFFLFPAIAITLATSDKQEIAPIQKIATPQKLAIGFLLLVTCYLLLVTSRYWYSDFLFAKGKTENDSGNFLYARKILLKATSLSPKESIFWDELSQSTTKIALEQWQGGADSEKFVDLAVAESGRAILLSPANVNLKRNRASLLTKLSKINPDLSLKAKEELEGAVVLAPTDAKLFYNLGLTYAIVGENQEALRALSTAAFLKPDYRDPHFATAMISWDMGDYQRAKSELSFILERLNPNDAEVKKELEELEIVLSTSSSTPYNY